MKCALPAKFRHGPCSWTRARSSRRAIRRSFSANPGAGGSGNSSPAWQTKEVALRGLTAIAVTLVVTAMPGSAAADLSACVAGIRNGVVGAGIDRGLAARALDDVAF